MNLDIINKQVANEFGFKENKVNLVNKFYWRAVKDHFYSFDERPVNIEDVCVFFPSQSSIKKAIRFYIKRIKAIRESKRYKPDSMLRESVLERNREILRGFWKIRKQNQYTN